MRKARLIFASVFFVTGFLMLYIGGILIQVSGFFPTSFNAFQCFRVGEIAQYWALFLWCLGLFALVGGLAGE